MKIKLLSDMVVSITSGYRNKSDIVLLSNKDISLLKVLDMLVTDGYISGYKMIPTGVIVYLRYVTGKPVVRGIKIIGTSVKPIVYSINNINSLNGIYGTIYVNTNKGFIDSKIAMRLGIGGISMIFIW